MKVLLCGLDFPYVVEVLEELLPANYQLITCSNRPSVKQISDVGTLIPAMVRIDKRVIQAAENLY